PPPPAASAPAARPAANPVLARVGTQAIRATDLAALAQGLPPSMRGLPQSTLYPVLLTQAVDRAALSQLARKEGLDKDPQVASAMNVAAEAALQNALLTKVIAPQVTPAKVRAAYDQKYAGKPGPEEVDARHILVKTKAEAEAIIAQLNKGADFAKLAKEHSIDPTAAHGGDLGFFTRDAMVAPFADAAFALKPGQWTQKPVHTQFGWHVIELVARRTQPTPTFAAVSDQIRQQMIAAAVRQEIAVARKGLKVQVFNPDGSLPRATDGAKPPAAKP
ncbi:MAG: peptidylprolyl isomerase, partial [Rhodospirillales bacterium]|nr:peptidylprolyl isomerase [Rhodospirillales bacterium]